MVVTAPAVAVAAAGATAAGPEAVAVSVGRSEAPSDDARLSKWADDPRSDGSSDAVSNLRSLARRPTGCVPTRSAAKRSKRARRHPGTAPYCGDVRPGTKRRKPIKRLGSGVREHDGG